jgi:hypothetical protein
MKLRCKQCGQPKPDNGWRICGPCSDSNQRYWRECEKLALALRHEFQRSPPGRQLPTEMRRPSEMRGRKCRAPRLAAHLRDDGDDE